MAVALVACFPDSLYLLYMGFLQLPFLMPLALFGVLGLAAVVLVHEAAEVVVIANGLRAGRPRPADGRRTPGPRHSPAHDVESGDPDHDRGQGGE